MTGLAGFGRMTGGEAGFVRGNSSTRKDAMMTKGPMLSGCACCGVSRRQFLASGCAACAGGVLAAPSLVRAAEGDKKFRIRVLYSVHAVKQPGPDWPNVGFDFAPVMERFNTAMTKACPDHEFCPEMANGAEAAKKIIEKDKATPFDGYIVFQLNCWNPVIQSIQPLGKPVLYVDFQFGGSGGFLVYNASMLRGKGPNVGFVASSKMEDLIAAVKCFDVVRKGGSPADFVAATARVRLGRTPKPSDMACKADALKPLSPEECLRRMKESKILAVASQESGVRPSIMEIPLEYVSFAEVNEAWKNADREEARAVADRWNKSASVVQGVSRETLETSAAMYLGQKAVMKKHNANAITINCLGGFYGGHIHAYPCLGFHELSNEGLVGACECDVRSTATMVAFTTMTQGRPGYISDPVIDTSKRQIIYAHCVASNRAFGPKGEANPFQILTHSEDRQGASVRSILPVGYMTTTMEIAPDRKEIIFHQAKAIENDPDDRACRTKLGADPVGDIEKLYTMWDQWGWHRVTFYGDLKEPAFGLAAALGWKIVQEA